ncbi:MAG: EF2563 family selenium-dependent molybdenum hydroxylase system protein [Clostridia bacterium]|nr:EF2563 family selenium-dependent molybdenum hydroxylase system protein [Clostridia bacterium]
MLVLIRGAGDIASGVALRLYNAGFFVIMTEQKKPTAIRRTVSFCEAVTNGSAEVEGVTSILADSPMAALEALKDGVIPILVDEHNTSIDIICPDVLVDAILAKKNLGTRKEDAPIVIALGPGFAAGKDCHAVIETMRGHNLGRVFYDGEAMQDTKTPGNIGGYTTERVIKATAAGYFSGIVPIGSIVRAGEMIGRIGDTPVFAKIDGMLRGILSDGVAVHGGMKCGDVDPRCEFWHCFTVSDKARSIGGGVLEAIMRLSKKEHIAAGNSRCTCALCLESKSDNAT